MLLPYSTRITNVLKFRETLVATVATQLFVSPFLLYKTGAISLVSLPANLFIFIFIPLTMLGCFMAGSLALIIPLLALPCAFISYGLLWYELWEVHFFASLPYAYLTIPSFPSGLLLSFYCGYTVIIVRWHMHHNENKANTKARK